VLAVERHGSGNPLVMVHGVGTTRAVWRHALPHLSAERQVVTLDLPGFGDSPPAGPGFPLDEVADLVADEVIDAAAAPVDLLGASLGGAVAVTVARRRPELVRRLILLAPAGFSPRPGAVAAPAGLAAAGFMYGRRMIGAPLVGNPLARRALLWGAVHDGGRLSPEDARAMIEASAGAKRVREAVEEVVALDLRPALAELEVPLGLIWGESDRVVPRSALDGILELRPGTPVETISEAGHVPQIERPAEFAAAIERLLSRLAAPA
jgi:pimeloyl-ACP methyl ester carboxylesterase